MPPLSGWLGSIHKHTVDIVLQRHAAETRWGDNRTHTAGRHIKTFWKTKYLLARWLASTQESDGQTVGRYVGLAFFNRRSVCLAIESYKKVIQRGWNRMNFRTSFRTRFRRLLGVTIFFRVGRPRHNAMHVSDRLPLCFYRNHTRAFVNTARRNRFDLRPAEGKASGTRRTKPIKQPQRNGGKRS